jgi:predicted dehydrogenase
MNARILLIGAGAIGARHLQALARARYPFQVDVVDPSDTALHYAERLLAEAGGLSDGVARLHSDLSRVDAADIAIVATAARERARLIADVLRLGPRHIILEKVLFTRLSDYDNVERLLTEHGVSAWVNCVRRAYPRAKRIIDLLRGKPFTYSVEGSGWGLGCNLIHHIDEFAMLSGRTDLRLCSNTLAPHTIPAKRAGYIEFMGTMHGSVGDNRFEATCGGGVPGDRVVTIICEDLELRVSQLAQTLYVRKAAGSAIEPFPIPLQSEATARHVEAILAGRSPSLPDYSEAATLHRLMLGAFLEHLRTITGDPSIEECPIT